MTFWLVTVLAACPALDVRLEGDRWSPSLAAEFQAEVHSELRDAPCAPSPQVVVEWPAEPSAIIDVRVTWQSEQTERQLRRRVDPRSVPADGLLLSLAAVVSDLVAESRQVPAIRSVLPVEREPSLVLAAKVAGGWYTAGSLVGTAGPSLRWLLPARFELEVDVSARAALRRSSELGAVSLVGLSGSLTFSRRVVGEGLWGLNVQLGSGASYWWAQVASVAPATGQNTTALTIDARGGVELVFRPGQVWWALGVTAGAPLRGVMLTDGTGTVLGVAGFEGAVSLSAGWAR